jgi:diguanylate cyclase (GGDEF)-like protein/putative nucleotidyltransferase with HDIG domain
MNKKLIWFFIALGAGAAVILARSSLHITQSDWPSLLALSLVIAVSCSLHYFEDIPESAVNFSGAAILGGLIAFGPHIALWAAAIGNLGFHLIRTGRLLSLVYNLSQDVLLGWITYQAFILLGGQWGPAFDHPLQALGAAGIDMIAGTLLWGLTLHLRGQRQFFSAIRAQLDMASVRAYMMTMLVGITVSFAFLKGGLHWAVFTAGFAWMLSDTLSRYFEIFRSARSHSQQLEAVLNATQGALIHTDDAGIVRVANRQAGVLFNADPDSLVGKPDNAIAVLREIRGQDVPDMEQIQEIVELVEGPARFVHWYRAAMRDQHGGLKGHVEVFTDVTPLKEAERNLRLLHDSMIRALTAAIDARDSYTHGHSSRVSAYSVAIARQMGMSAKDLERIEYSGLLHDIGKLGIDDRVLRKHGALSPSERALMMQHPVIGAEVLQKANVLTELIPGVRWHHEWISGGGYPDGLRGAEIPLDARIIGAADALDAMTTDRPYRPALPLQEVLNRLLANAGVQFDVDVVAACAEAIDNGSLVVANRVEEPPVDAPGEAEGTIRPVHGKELSILYELSREDYASLNLESMLQRYLETFHDIIGTNAYLIYLLSAETGELELRSWVGVKDRESGLRKDLRLVREAIENRRPVVVDDLRLLGGYTPAGGAAKSEVVVPLISQTEVLGALAVEAALPAFFRKDDIYLLEAIARHLCGSIKLVRYHERLAFAANHDGLTGVFNHSYFYDRLTEEVARAARYKRNVTVALLDLNGMKAINDTYGHLVGDAVLRDYAVSLQKLVRGLDIVARYGGDEFAIILPETGREEAERAVRRLAAGLTRPFTYGDLEIPMPTASWGIASYPDEAARAAELVSIADRAMYREKQAAAKPQRKAR